MASGWANDDAVNEQINSTIEDAVARARGEIPRGESLTECEECGDPIPEARRKAIPGVRLCIACQQEKDSKMRHIQDIIAGDRKTASYVDFPLPKLTAPVVYFTLTTFSETRSKTCPSDGFCKAHPQEVSIALLNLLIINKLFVIQFFEQPRQFSSILSSAKNRDTYHIDGTSSP